MDDGRLEHSIFGVISTFRGLGYRVLLATIVMIAALLLWDRRLLQKWNLD